jgi:predicted MFS family arabinose efflux permease
MSAHEWRRGWPVIAAAMLANGTGPGVFQNLSSLFTPGMAQEFDWTRGDIATASGVGLAGGLLAPFLGRLADRLGVRPLIVGSMLLLGLAYIGMALQDGALWQYRVLVFCLAASVAGTSALVYGKLISARFVAHRGLALGVATSGLSLSTLLLPPVVGAVIAAYGWRGGFVTLSGLVLLVALPLIGIVIWRLAPPSGGAGQIAQLAASGLTGPEARRTGRFWRLVLSALLINVATAGLVTQLVPFGIDHGLGAGQAALLLVSYGASQVVGRLTIGLLVDHFRPALMAAGFALVSAVAFAGLQLGAPGFPLMMAIVFFAGLMHGADSDLLPFLTARLFGLRGYGEIYGMALMIALIGTATGIVGFGRLHDATGDYSVALAVACGALVVSAILFLSLDDRARPADDAQSASA